MKSNSLELTELMVGREDAPLIAPLSLRLDAGEVLLVRGSNGSGKSTFLKTLAGLIRPFSGTLSFNGHWPMQHAPLYLGHKQGLAREMTVRDNVLLWSGMGGYQELAGAAMHYFELEDIADVPLAQLSAGWQQRVMLTRLITLQSPLWLLDEPTANLDQEGAQLLQSLMQVRLEQGGIVVVATHSTMEGEMIKSININELNRTPQMVN